MTDSDIIVTVADREAAWLYAPACYLKTDYNAWMAGLYDKSAPIIMVFARHAAQARLEALEEAAKVADRIAYEQRVKRAFDGEPHSARPHVGADDCPPRLGAAGHVPKEVSMTSILEEIERLSGDVM